MNFRSRPRIRPLPMPSVRSSPSSLAILHASMAASRYFLSSATGSLFRFRSGSASPCPDWPEARRFAEARLARWHRPRRRLDRRLGPATGKGARQRLRRSGQMVSQADFCAALSSVASTNPRGITGSRNVDAVVQIARQNNLVISMTMFHQPSGLIPERANQNRPGVCRIRGGNPSRPRRAGKTHSSCWSEQHALFGSSGLLTLVHPGQRRQGRLGPSIHGDDTVRSEDCILNERPAMVVVRPGPKNPA